MENSNSKILGITLARGGSKSVPRKNVKLLGGKPLITYTITEALKSRLIDRYIISTDDEEIAKVSESFGAEVPFIRPDNLSGDTVSSVDALQHAVNYVEEEEGSRYDYIIELMCTNPSKTIVDIDACIELLIQSGADSVIAVHKLEDHHPARIKKIVDGRLVDFCVQEEPEMRRQDLKPDAYVRSGSIYALRRDHLMVDCRRYGSRESLAYILPAERAVNVDTEADFHLAEFMITKAGQAE